MSSTPVGFLVAFGPDGCEFRWLRAAPSSGVLGIVEPSAKTVLYDLMRSGALATLSAGALAGAHAASTTVNHITLDVPARDEVSSVKRGALIEFRDDEVDVPVEIFLSAASKTLLTEHADDRQKEPVDIGDATTSNGKSGDADVENTAFGNASGKGGPTVVWYSAVGPFWSRKQVPLVACWASPTEDTDLE